jgi:3-deoxy-manno-octulosonate cytidylyltransferase (CMP-KDO synthetase)
MHDRVVAIIPARIDSSRFPAKMIADSSGKPLIQYAWEVANAAKCVTQVFIATDSPEIARTVESFGGTVVMTGEHPNGTSRIAEVVREIECDLVVNLQGDEPELDPSVIDDTVGVICDRSMATAACPLLDGEIDNEHVVKVVIDDSGCALDFARITDDKSAMRHIGLYVYKPAFLQTYVAMQPTQNEIARRLEQMRVLDNGYEIAVACVATQPGGIDTEEQYDAFVKRVG